MFSVTVVAVAGIFNIFPSGITNFKGSSSGVLENEDFTITEYDDVVVRQLIEKVTVIDKNTINITFKGGFEVRKELHGD